MREFQEMAKPTGLAEADAELDRALRLVGIEPGKEAQPSDERGWQERLHGKMQQIQRAGPQWVQRGGDPRELQTIMQEFERRAHNIGSASYAEKERKLDEAVRLLGLTYRPGPDTDVPQIYYADAQPFWVRDKMRRNQAAAGEFAKRGGNSAKLEAILKEFERKMRLATTEWDIYYRCSRDGGRKWDPEVRLTGARGLSHRPSLGGDGDDLYVSWWDGRDGKNEIYLKRSRDGGRTWGADVPVTQSAGDATKPSLALDHEYLHLIWLDARDGSPKLLFRRAARPVVE
jgi:hypothetical protein